MNFRIGACRWNLDGQWPPYNNLTIATWFIILHTITNVGARIARPLITIITVQTNYRANDNGIIDGNVSVGCDDLGAPFVNSSAPVIP